MKKILLAFFFIVPIITGCASLGSENSSNVPSSINSVSSINSTSSVTLSTSQVSSDSSLLNFDGAIFENATFDYDGSEHAILVTGNLPENAHIEYVSNKAVDAGIYSAQAVLSKSGYHTQTLTAILTIQKIGINGISFLAASFEYDGNEKQITITGQVPSGVSVTYENNKATEVGVHVAKATLSGNNYTKTVLTAELTIYALEEELFTYIDGQTVYFQNNLDNNQLYQYTDGTLNKVNSDTPQHFTKYKGEIYYKNSSLLGSTIAKLRIADNKRVNVYTKNAEYLINDGTNIYFVVNSIFAKDYGIYRLSLESDVPVATLIAKVRAKYLNVDADNLYFANASDGDKLYKIAKTSIEGTATLLYNYKVSYLLLDSNTLYFNRHNLLGNSIYSIKTDGTDIAEICNDSAKYLVKNGDCLYYSNIDLLTSNLFGKGIRKVKIDNGVISTLVADTPVSSLNTSGDDVYFYKVNDKKLYKVSVNGGEPNDLLQDFVAPTSAVINGLSGTMAIYNDSLYFQNFYDGNKLYQYNSKTLATTRITSQEVDEILIHGDYIYYRAVSYFINKSLYRLNIRIGGEPEMLTSSDCANLAIANNRLYYTNYTGTNSINSMSLDGTGVKVLRTNATSDYLKIFDNKLYFANGKDDNKMFVMDLEGTNYTKVLKNNDEILGLNISASGKIYYRRNGLISNSLRVVNSANPGTNDGTEIAAHDPKSITIIGDDVYYYNDQVVGYGIYKYEEGKNAIKLLGSVAENITYFAEELYYYNSSSGDITKGDGKLYKCALDGSNVTLIG